MQHVTVQLLIVGSQETVLKCIPRNGPVGIHSRAEDLKTGNIW